MEKKIKFSEQPTKVKIVYSAVIAILCITAIVVGIVAANNRKGDDDLPPVDDGSVNEGGENTDNGDNAGNNTDQGNENQTPDTTDTVSFTSPTVGTVSCVHSTSIPVYSTTLEEWRMHTGIDITTNDGAEVYAVSDGTVSAVRYDAKFGYTVEITHNAAMRTIYSNLTEDSLTMLTVGDTVSEGQLIGYVGDSATSELAEEPHLHFGVFMNDVAVDPLEYISEESKEASLGIVSE